MAKDVEQDVVGNQQSRASASPTRPGEYVVVARRYRPQGFQDLVGQGTVSKALCNALATDRVGHAYLFTGARGVGKTSTARILAKALNCVTGPTTTPCDECDICQQVASGVDVDVLEIDGASNRGIDEIRQLRSNVGIRPSRARFKVYIIDEVHMLTKEAFNALLKTLEEPPEHVKFVFCTTEPGKIPVTVLSRCQRFDFAPVMTQQIVERLQYIVQQEGATADLASLELLARRAAGSMRDSQSLLEQLLSFVNEPITVDHVHAMLGTARDERLQSILAAVNARDAAEALASLDQALREGVDAGQLGEQLVGSMRDMMAALVGCPGELLLQHAPSQLADLKAAAETWGLPGVLAAVQILDQAIARMRQSVHGRVLLEVALVRIAQLENLQSLAELIGQVQRGEIVGEPSAESKKKTNDAMKPTTESPDASVSRLNATSLQHVSQQAAPTTVVRVDASHTRPETRAVGPHPSRSPSSFSSVSSSPSSGADARSTAQHASSPSSSLVPAGHAPSLSSPTPLQPPTEPQDSVSVSTEVGAPFAEQAPRSLASGSDPPAATVTSGLAASEILSEGSDGEALRQAEAGQRGDSGEVWQDEAAARDASSDTWSNARCKQIWAAALGELNDMTADYAGLASSVASFGPNRLVVRFEQMYNSSKSFCERPERRQLLEEAVSRIAGRSMRLEFELTQDDAHRPLSPTPVISRQQQLQQVTRHPFVERAVQLFAGEVMHVDVKERQTKE
jgi:DNA polymerase-3 subunit gamma/tau